MAKAEKMITNSAGREVPDLVNGEQAIPFMGVGKYAPDGTRHGPAIRSSRDYP